MTTGDFAGALVAAERWTAADPMDDEAQHRLIAALAAAGERTDAIRQYETYARLLAPEGLEPLDETRDLVARLRTGPPVGPTRCVALGSGSTQSVPRDFTAIAPESPALSWIRRSVMRVLGAAGAGPLP